MVLFHNVHKCIVAIAINHIRKSTFLKQKFTCFVITVLCSMIKRCAHQCPLVDLLDACILK